VEILQLTTLTLSLSGEYPVAELSTEMQLQLSSRQLGRDRTENKSRSVITKPLHSKDRGADHIGNIVLLLLRALPSNGCCLPSHCLATGLWATTLTIEDT
jgi:hypothetical protein